MKNIAKRDERFGGFMSKVTLGFRGVSLLAATAGMFLSADLLAAQFRSGSLEDVYQDQILQSSSEGELLKAAAKVASAPIDSGHAYQLLESVLRSSHASTDTTDYLKRVCDWSDKSPKSAALKKKSDRERLRALVTYAELSPKDQWASCQKTREYQESKVFKTLVHDWLMVLDTSQGKPDMDGIRFYRSAGAANLSPGEISAKIADCEKIFWANGNFKPVTSERGVLLELHKKKAGRAD
ncbi:MAG: hypothetical protein A2X94_16135 [Bdellovibrionales bacterium GWB1_55_8]|nr:MAG: hypothetical protein A2X94_16135 [Bdellovibrionales bacterium GWB1_55_8]